MLEQIVFYVSFPLLLRWKNSREVCVQDLCVATVVASCVSICFWPGSILGLFVHFCELLDAFLYQEMGLRLRFGHWAHLRNGGTLWASARQMRAGSWLFCGLGLLVAHGLHAKYMTAADFSWTGGLAAVFFCAWGWKGGYESDHALIYAFRSSFSKKKVADPLAFRSFVFEGQKLPVSLKTRPHVVFLFLESFAQTAVCPKVTPRFSELVKQGLFFSNHYANGTITYRVYLSALFGIPPAGTVQGLGPYVGLPLEGVAERMRDAGYKTAFHHNGSLGFDRQRDFLKDHFDLLIDRADLTAGGGAWGVEDEHLMRYSADWLKRQKEPTFLTLFTITNHHPWVLPEGYRAPSFGYGANSPKERFYQTMHYSDFCLGLFVDLLKDQNAILFVVGDHGQPMGEHRGNFFNSRFLYEENIRVPLLVLGKGIEPKVFSDPTSHLDLLPTLCDLVGVAARGPQVGTSLLRPIPERSIFFQNPYSEGFWGCRKGIWKWIGETLSDQQELYQLDQDPAEAVNLAEAYPEKAAEMKRETEQFFQSVEAYYRERRKNPPPASLELDLSHQLVRDWEVVDKIPKDLRILALEDCHLLTDDGIGSIFKKCSDLEWVSLKGISDLGDKSLIHAPQSLERLNMGDAEGVTDEGLFHLANRCPRLRVLSVKGDHLTDRGLAALRPGLVRFEIRDGLQITEEGWIAFFMKNSQLNRLSVRNCPHFTVRVREFVKDLSVEKVWVD